MPGHHYPGYNRDLAGTYPGDTGFTEYCVPADPGPTLGLSGEIFLSKGLEIYYPGMSTSAGTLTKGAQGYGAGIYPGIYKKNAPPPKYWAVHWAVPGPITKYKIEYPGKSLLSLGSGGWGAECPPRLSTEKFLATNWEKLGKGKGYKNWKI